MEASLPITSTRRTNPLSKTAISMPLSLLALWPKGVYPKLMRVRTPFAYKWRHGRYRPS